MKVVIIDDDKVFTEPLVWCLVQEGWAVTLRRSVDEVFDENGNLKGGKPDCVILDIMMPWGAKYSSEETANGKQTGLRLLEEIARVEPSLPIIIITVREDLRTPDLKERFGAQVEEVLVKPVVPTKVLDVLELVFPGTYTRKVKSDGD